VLLDPIPHPNNFLATRNITEDEAFALFVYAYFLHTTRLWAHMHRLYLDSFSEHQDIIDGKQRTRAF
jgi:hypothetical protein